jgi:hypothetical protein
VLLEIPTQPIGSNWYSYCWILSKKFGVECYETWRSELLASVLVLIATYGLTVHENPTAWRDFQTALLAVAITLGGFALWHIVRSPWLVHRSAIIAEKTQDHWGFGVFGITIITALMFATYWLALYIWQIRSIQLVVKIPPPPAPVLKQPENKGIKTESRRHPPVPPSPQPNFASIRIASDKPVVSTDQTFPYAVELILQTDTPISPVAFTVTCTGEVGKGRAGSTVNPFSMMGRDGHWNGDLNTFGFEWQTPAFTPEDPIRIMIWSRLYISCTKVVKFEYNLMNAPLDQIENK